MKPLFSRLFSIAAIAICVGAISGCGGDSLFDKLHNPIVTSSDKTPTKLETKWSRLCFGHYPDAEVVNDMFDNVADYAYESDDVLFNATLYDELVDAEWVNDAVVLGNARFERVLEPNASSSSQHYTYDDPGSQYHYFRCSPIVWRVLSLDGKKATLMADQALDCLYYHPNEHGPDWKESYIRSYLNSLDASENEAGVSFLGGGFLDKAFSKKERNALLKHQSTESINHDYDVTTGKACEDYVYLLDNDEMYASDKAASNGFYNGRGYDDPAKRFTSTMYAKFKGCWYSPVEPYRGNCFHFMRTPGYKKSYVSYICDFGYIYSRGTSADCFDAGIVPVIDVDLSLADWSLMTERSSVSMMRTTLSQEGDNRLGEHKWDTVEYGHYPQDEVKQDDSRYEKLSKAEWIDDVATLDDAQYKRIGNKYYQYQPISWRILEKDGDSALLFASSGLDCHRYHDTLSNTDWAHSGMREFLNNDFLAEAFSGDDEAIIEKQIDNKANYYFGTDCGQSTKDKIFLLQEEDVFGTDKAATHGFAPSDATTDEGRRIVPTDYAKGRGAWVSKDGNGFYSLRTVGYSNSNAVYVGDLGDIYNRGIPVTCSDMTLAPAMWVQLSLIGD